ncbi:hypothetical protein FH5_05410 [Priestia endophytica]|nr:hypothetical protein FH5_05410 [Priestia endophytica]
MLALSFKTIRDKVPFNPSPDCYINSLSDTLEKIFERN